MRRAPGSSAGFVVARRLRVCDRGRRCGRGVDDRDHDADAETDDERGPEDDPVRAGGTLITSVSHHDAEPIRSRVRGCELISQRRRDSLGSDDLVPDAEAGAPRLGRAPRARPRLRRAAARHGRLGRGCRVCSRCSPSSTRSTRTSPARASTRRRASTPRRPTRRRTTSRRLRATGSPTSRACSSSSISSGSRSTTPRPRRCSRRPSSSRTRTACRSRARRSRTSCPEGEEQALNARRPAISAWESLHGRELATLTVDFDAGDGSEPHTLDRLLSYVHHPDREIRLAALDTVYEALDGRGRRAGGLLRRDRRRPALGRPAPRRPRPDAADEPRERARRLRSSRR